MRDYSADAVSFVRAFRDLEEDLVPAGAQQQQDSTVLCDAAISMLTVLAAVQRAVGRRILTGGRTLRCVRAFLNARAPRDLNILPAISTFHSLVVQLRPSPSRLQCSFSGAYEAQTDIRILARSSQRAALDELACVRLR